MAHVIVTNRTEAPFPIGGLYVTVLPRRTFEFARTAEYLNRMTSLLKAARDGAVTLQVYYTPEDIASGQAALEFSE
jgi:hypothetical protein